MRKKIKLLNRIFCIFMYFLSFMTILSLVFNLIYLTPIYDIILNKHPLTYTIILFSIILSILLTRLLVHLLADLQRKFLE
jgi:hypothetical protein